MEQRVCSLKKIIKIGNALIYSNKKIEREKSKLIKLDVQKEEIKIDTKDIPRIIRIYIKNLYSTNLKILLKRKMYIFSGQRPLTKFKSRSDKQMKQVYNPQIKVSPLTLPNESRAMLYCKTFKDELMPIFLKLLHEITSRNIAQFIL